MPPPVAIILAGGANRRFWPLAQKSLLRFGDRSLLERHVDALGRAGFVDVVVVANPDNETAIRRLEPGSAVRLHVVVQPEPGGMGDAVLQCEPLLRGPLGDRPAMISQVHDLVEPGLFRCLVERLESDARSDGAIVGVRRTSYFPGGYLVLKDGRAVDVIEKPGAGNEPSALVKIVADLVRRPADLLDALRKVEANPVDQYERALGRVMASGRVEVVEYEGQWVPVKYPWDVLRATELMLDQMPADPQIGPGVSVHPSATVSGRVLLGEGVKLFAGAAVVGPAIIGAGTIIGNGALVRGSVVGRNCIVGFATEVARSYIGDGCEFHTNYVGDSVIGDDVSFGSGTTTANLRIDEGNIRITLDGERLDTGKNKLGAMIGAHVRTGINVSIMPGVRIGSGSVVGPHVMLSRDLAEQQIVTLQQSLEVRPNRFPIDGASRAAFRARIR